MSYPENTWLPAEVTVSPRTTERNKSLISRYFVDVGGRVNGGQGRNRTNDTRIFSPLLYQLSYLAIEAPGTTCRGPLEGMNSGGGRRRGAY